MLAEVRKCAENRDIKGLHYIFVDSLDVDPTFETYREDYEYCKKIDGMFEPHREISPVLSDQTRWTSQYWEQLKLDLMKNFSQQRFEHMISVARIVYSDKISRLVAERNKKNKKVSADVPADAPNRDNRAPAKGQTALNDSRVTIMSAEAAAVSEAENQRIERKKRELEAENRRVEAKQQAQRERMEAARRAEPAKQNASMDDGKLKKALGIALAALAIVAVVLIIVVLQ